MSLLKHPIIAFLKLIRIENLLIIAITQWCIKYLIFTPINPFSTFTPFLFTISLTSTILIAAAGYIINDYFDVKTDKINKPHAVVIDVFVKRRWAMILHILFNIIGLMLGFYLALTCHNLKLILIQLLSIILLWFYSTHFKKQLLVGNITVAILTACIPLIPLVYDYYLMKEADSFTKLITYAFIKTLSIITFGYAVFAFLTSFTREVIKDIEDYKGDMQTGCKTMPIVWGVITSKVVTFFIITITIGLLLLASIKFYKNKQIIAVYYILFFVILPLMGLLIQIIKAKNSRDFKRSSLILKLIMLFGIAFTLIINFFYY